MLSSDLRPSQQTWAVGPPCRPVLQRIRHHRLNKRLCSVISKGHIKSCASENTRQFPLQCRFHDRSHRLSSPETKKTLALGVEDIWPYVQVMVSACTNQRMDQIHHVTLCTIRSNLTAASSHQLSKSQNTAVQFGPSKKAKVAFLMVPSTSTSVSK